MWMNVIKHFVSGIFLLKQAVGIVNYGPIIFIARWLHRRQSQQAAFEKEFAGRILLVTAGAPALPGIASTVYEGPPGLS